MCYDSFTMLNDSFSVIPTHSPVQATHVMVAKYTQGRFSISNFAFFGLVSDAMRLFGGYDQ